MSLTDQLISQGWLKTPRIISAFNRIKRVDFLPEKLKKMAEVNEALSIGFGQTISQPLVVAFMLELLDPKPGENILDIGSGSGWVTALLAEIVSRDKNKKGKVIAVEIIPELKEFGEKNISKYNFIDKKIVQFICSDGCAGYLNGSPFDKILVSASARNKIPQALKKQLKIKGRIVASIDLSIFLFVKTSLKEFEIKEYPGFTFVPLI